MKLQQSYALILITMSYTNFVITILYMCSIFYSICAFSCIKMEFTSCDDAYFGLHPSSDALQLHLYLNHHLSQQMTVLEITIPTK